MPIPSGVVPFGGPYADVARWPRSPVATPEQAVSLPVAAGTANTAQSGRQLWRIPGAELSGAAPEARRARRRNIIHSSIGPGLPPRSPTGLPFCRYGNGPSLFAWITAPSAPAQANCGVLAGKWTKEPAGRTRPFDRSNTVPSPKPNEPEITVMFSAC
jgi:hypothetical protein